MSGLWIYSDTVDPAYCTTLANGRCRMADASDEYKFFYSDALVRFEVTDVNYTNSLGEVVPYWQEHNHDEDGDSQVEPDPWYIEISPPLLSEASSTEPSTVARTSLAERTARPGEILQPIRDGPAAAVTLDAQAGAVSAIRWAWALTLRGDRPIRKGRGEL